MPKDRFTFVISLSVLNHLGRNLYRSFVTVLGEAISNAWDADAKNVHIFVDKENNNFVIKDDGIGMTTDDFQNKFLKIGYSKRKEGSSKSPKGRPFIGRKGIGKLALLSCAERITVISKIKDGEYVGGTIDNSGLDEAITEDQSAKDYKLEGWNSSLFRQYMKDHNHGTIIRFENIKENIKNHLSFLKKIVALYFRFSLVDASFNIYINDEEVTLDDLSELAGKTQFLWNINNFTDSYINKTLSHLDENPRLIKMKEDVKGFIASVRKPSNLKIRGMSAKISVDLFVNGRIRERDILRHIPTARVPENYLYGQIHCDDLDDEEKDRFTSSREGIIADDPKFQEFLKSLRKELGKIIEQWDKLREKYGDDGDIDNKRILRRERKARELYNTVLKDYILGEDSKKKPYWGEWGEDMQEGATHNFISYAQCFISENLLRKYIEKNKKIPTSCTKVDEQGKTCIDRKKDRKEDRKDEHYCEYCKGKKGKEKFQKHKKKANISINIRKDEDNLLLYLDYPDLVKVISDTVLKKEKEEYRLFRNSVMHTSHLTKEAKRKLTSIFDNILATVKILVRRSWLKNK